MSAPESLPQSAESPGARRPAGFGELARRMRGRTTDLIAIGVVLVAGLSFGRQVTEWWRDEPAKETPADNAATTGGWGDGGAPVTLEFGDSPFAMSRQSVPGDREQALKRLRERCRTIVESISEPTRPLDDAERAILTKTKTLKPIAEQPGHWRLYEIVSQFTMICGVRDVRPNNPETSSRVVCWGMAFPMSERSWNLYVFTETTAPSTALSGLPDVPVAPGGRRILSLKEDCGGSLVGFSGNGSPQSWSRFYDNWFKSHGWHAPHGWNHAPGNHAARFVPQEANQLGSVDIQLGEDGSGAVMGLISRIGE